MDWQEIYLRAGKDIQDVFTRLAEVERERDEARARVAAAYEEAAAHAMEVEGSRLGIEDLPRPEETDALARIRAEAVEEAAQMFDDVHLDYEGAVVVSMLRARAAAIREDKT